MNEETTTVTEEKPHKPSIILHPRKSAEQTTAERYQQLEARRKSHLEQLARIDQQLTNLSADTSPDEVQQLIRDKEALNLLIEACSREIEVLNHADSQQAAAADRVRDRFAHRIATGERALEACRLVGALGFRAALINEKGDTEEKEFELDVECPTERRERWAAPGEGPDRRPVRLPDGPRFAISGLKAALPTLLVRADSERLNLLVEALGAHIFSFECSGSKFVSQDSLRRMLPHSFLAAEISRGETEVLLCLSKNEIFTGRLSAVRPVDRSEADKMAHQIGANLGVKDSPQFFLPGSMRFVEGTSFEVVAHPSAIVEVDRQKLVNSGVLLFDSAVDGPAERAARATATHYAQANGSSYPKI